MAPAVFAPSRSRPLELLQLIHRRVAALGDAQFHEPNALREPVGKPGLAPAVLDDLPVQRDRAVRALRHLHLVLAEQVSTLATTFTLANSRFQVVADLR